jgi:hypothetical protein
MQKYYELNRDLNKLIWDKTQIKKHVYDTFYNYARDWLKFIGVPMHMVHDIYFTGSNASYGYHEKSDIDINIIVKITDESQKIDTSWKYSEWRYQNRIQKFYGHDIDLVTYFFYDHEIITQRLGYFKDQGNFSLLKGQWNQIPTDQGGAVIIPEQFTESYMAQKNNLDRIINYDFGVDIDYSIIDYMTSHNRFVKGRYQDMLLDGDYCNSQLVIKQLNKEGLIEKYHNHIFQKRKEFDENGYLKMLQEAQI